MNIQVTLVFLVSGLALTFWGMFSSLFLVLGNVGFSDCAELPDAWYQKIIQQIHRKAPGQKRKNPGQNRINPTKD